MRILNLIALLAIVAAPVSAQQSPSAALDSLIAADREFSASAAGAADIPTALSAMFDADVVMPAPGGHAVGRDAVTAAFRQSPNFKEGTIIWRPIRGGISADGTQGFTYGFLSLTAGDQTKRERKYLAYWVKRPEGWRVASYRQIIRPAGEVRKDMLPPSLPAFQARPVADPAVIAAHQRSIAAAEKSFSDRAKVVGLKAAFREFGREDAMNMYEGADFKVGLDAITASFKEGEPADIHWGTERSFVASSGDLGVSIGTIHPDKPGADGKPQAGFPFFTVWKRDKPDGPWRYIAE